MEIIVCWDAMEGGGCGSVFSKGWYLVVGQGWVGWFGAWQLQLWQCGWCCHHGEVMLLVAELIDQVMNALLQCLSVKVQW